MSEEVPLVKAVESKQLLSLQLLDRIGTAPPVSEPIGFDQSPLDTLSKCFLYRLVKSIIGISYST